MQDWRGERVIAAENAATYRSPILARDGAHWLIRFTRSRFPRTAAHTGGEVIASLYLLQLLNERQLGSGARGVNVTRSVDVMIGRFRLAVVVPDTTYRLPSRKMVGSGNGPV